MVSVLRAWTPAEVRAAIEAILDGADLPADRATPVVLKPNFNNDLPGLTGNSTDFRVIVALIAAFQARGYRDLTLADGPNVGVHRRGIDVFRRLRADRLPGVRVVDLNRDEGRPIALADGSPRVARTWLDAGLRVLVAKIKTHVEAGLSCAVKGLVGVCVGQDKRLMHRDLPRNLAALAEAAPPHLVVTDGLVAMEGAGPGDGDPVRLELLLGAHGPGALWRTDRAVCRLLGLDLARVPAFAFGPDLPEPVLDPPEPNLAPMPALVPAPPRTRLARWADRPGLAAIKRRLAPITANHRINRILYRIGALQDVYDTQDDAITGLVRDPEKCGSCRTCEDVCPVGLAREDIGMSPPASACVGCLYCWWACPGGAIDLQGSPGALAGQAARYKLPIESMVKRGSRMKEER